MNEMTAERKLVIEIQVLAQFDSSGFSSAVGREIWSEERGAQADKVDECAGSVGSGGEVVGEIVGTFDVDFLSSRSAYLCSSRDVFKLQNRETDMVIPPLRRLDLLNHSIHIHNARCIDYYINGAEICECLVEDGHNFALISNTASANNRLFPKYRGYMLKALLHVPTDEDDAFCAGFGPCSSYLLV